MYIAKHNVELAGRMYAPGDTIHTIPADKVERLLRIGAVKRVVRATVMVETDGNAEDTPAATAPADEIPVEEAPADEIDADDPPMEIDVSEGIVNKRGKKNDK